MEVRVQDVWQHNDNRQAEQLYQPLNALYPRDIHLRLHLRIRDIEILVRP